ncbi:Cu(I)-responsive transcriptional regulator [Jannaschia formosa]|uniref:Cu(I)-responsive transcriptional regulator n=1 Tax=Jannaschia formosa TaxID=2259592 RepID=UPI000E1BC584|nr:Cu(I)-responsive transcriptional regulator [Jannaschia formosa]TFL19351.1 Cu(I)-responsive transcriptional regulator [Jannaschia formosa]
MNIGDVARRTGVPAKTIRYYEEIDLIRPARTGNGYRAFSEADLHKLVFVGRARALGFPVEQCRTLLALWDDETRSSAEVKRIAERQLGEIDAKIAALREMRGTLAHLIGACAGDARPDCPILESLSDPEAAA